MLDLSRLRHFQHFHYLEAVGSTNDYLKTFLDQQIPRIAMAREQTGGKGRYGRRWESPPGEGLYVSYLLFPTWKGNRAPFLTYLSCLAVIGSVRAAGGAGLPLRLKEPNDVYVGPRKLAGALTEVSTVEDRLQWAILGIGINLYQQDFPPHLQGRATSLALEGLLIEDPLAFCLALSRRVEEYYTQLEAGLWLIVEQEYREWLGRGGEIPPPRDEEEALNDP